jgi:hypothetical protein
VSLVVRRTFLRTEREFDYRASGVNGLVIPAAPSIAQSSAELVEPDDIGMGAA